tara:strand:+ start:1511 stop:1726 length:216 start_codon:yes stop_codon:yes gene_type:complete
MGKTATVKVYGKKVIVEYNGWKGEGCRTHFEGVKQILKRNMNLPDDFEFEMKEKDEIYESEHVQEKQGVWG